MDEQKKLRLDILYYQLIIQSDELVFTLKTEKTNFFALTSGFIIEIIFRYIVIDKEIDENSHRPMPLMRMIKSVEKAGIPKRIIETSNVIRTYRNFEAHPAFKKERHEDYFERCKTLIYKILEWFFTQYINNSSDFDKIKRKLEIYHINVGKESWDYLAIQEFEERMRSEIKNLGTKVVSHLNILEEKLDNVQVTVHNFIDNFNSFKKKQRSELYEILDILTAENKISIKPYYDKVEQAINEIEFLEKSGKTLEYLAAAEYLFENFQQSEQEDFAPCILQFCRVIEGELYHQVFSPFEKYLKENYTKKRINKLILNSEDKINRGKCLISSENPMAILSGLKGYFEFGKMRCSIDILIEDDFKEVPIYQELYKYVVEKVFSDFNLISDKNFTGTLKSIGNSRNKAAHTYSNLLTKQEAEKVKRDTYYLLRKWISSLKNS